MFFYMTVLFNEFEFYNFNKFNQILVLDFNEIIERVTMYIVLALSKGCSYTLLFFLHHLS